MSAPAVLVTVRLFGAFRDLPVPDGALRVALPRGATVAELREAIAGELARAVPERDATTLVRRSAIGNEREILAETARLETSGEVALLPPVCGGIL